MPIYSILRRWATSASITAARSTILISLRLIFSVRRAVVSLINSFPYISIATTCRCFRGICVAYGNRIGWNPASCVLKPECIGFSWKAYWSRAHAAVIAVPASSISTAVAPRNNRRVSVNASYIYCSRTPSSTRFSSWTSMAISPIGIAAPNVSSASVKMKLWGVPARLFLHRRMSLPASPIMNSTPRAARVSPPTNVGTSAKTAATFGPRRC